MNRLQKKCFIAAAAFHLLLLSILFVGPAFLPAGRTDDLPVLDVIPAILIDAAMSGGGNPNDTQPLPPPPAPTLQTLPQPTPQPPTVKPVLKEVRVPDPKSLEKTTAKPPPQKVAVNTTPVTRPTNPTARQPTQKELQEQQRAAAQRLAEAVDRILRGLKENLSSSTAVEIPGPGGEAYANYKQVVMSVYDRAWIAPSDMADDVAVVAASVTIASDGTVLSARVTSPSGSATVDASVRTVLQRVKFIAPFPEGAKDAERTFIISFDLKAKRLNG